MKEPIPPGTLDMLILTTLAHEPRLHGFEIAERIERRSSQVLQVEEGSLYPALQRMLVKGWISGEWGRTADNRRARYYGLTASGRKQLARELDSYRRVTQAIGFVLEPA
jgi:PadR family transcriptional regulator, regulatory protein PadR